ncbi:MAG: hypothetical protein NTY37_06965 [Methanothrix sp.]|nr:hypothetical protein [Methanothrix sp.]
MAEIDEISLELDVTETGTIAIGNKQVYFCVKLDLNMAAHWGGIVIMGNKEECQVPRIHARIIKGGEEIL